MSFLTAMALPRRTVLRGIGATLALPLLDAMVPALSLRARAAAAPVHRFQTFYVPNGMAMEYWSPKGEGSAFELSPSWSRWRHSGIACWCCPASRRTGITFTPAPRDRF